MLSRKYRISLAKPLKLTKKIAKDNLVLFWSQNSQSPKFAIVVPAKFCKKAVGRNRTRRLIWQNLNELKDGILPGIYKILVKADFSNLKKDEIALKIKDLFGLAGVFK